MCPACMATANWMVAGVTSMGGLSALFFKQLRAKKVPSQPEPEEKSS